MFRKEVYQQRRKKLADQIKEGLVLLLGNTYVPMNYPANTYPWRQDSNFLYFIGIDNPGLAAILDIDNNKEYLLGNDATLDDIIWMGNQPGMEEKCEDSGIENALPYNQLFEKVNHALNLGRKVHFLPPYRAENKILLQQLLGIAPESQKQQASTDFIKAVVALRSQKDQLEIAEIEQAMEVAWLMHTTAMKMARPGIYEREIASAIESIALSHGGRLSFPAIVTKNGETLHNHYHGNKLKSGDLLLVDAGTESAMHYATDHTRTTPVGGKFSIQQLNIYEVVLNALNQSIAMIKPGITNLAVHLTAATTIAQGLKDLGLMKGDISSAVEQGAHALFFPHGIGHMLGLDVHDMEDLGENYVGYDDEIKRSDIFGTAFLRLGRAYKPGFVITIEPGCYFIPALIDKWREERKFPEFINYNEVGNYRDFGGIRIEDDILVTDEGYQVLGQPIPKTPQEIESLMM